MDKLRPLLYVAGALLLGYLWLTFAHDPQIRRGALQQQQDRRDDSTHRANEVWKAQFLARDTARDDSLRKLSAGIRGALGEIARLKANVTYAEESPADSLHIRIIAVRDSIIAQQDTVIAQQDAELTIWRARVFARDTLIARREGEVRALTLARDNWKRAAQPGLFVKLGRGLPWLAAGVVAGALLTR